MKSATTAADFLLYSRDTATRDQLEFACQALAGDEYSDHAIAAMLDLDVQTIRAAIGREVSIAST